MLPRVPPLIGFLLRHCALGAAAGALLLAGLVGFDVGGFGDLIWRSESPLLVLVVLQWAFTITFGSAAMGSAIFLLPSAPPEDDGARRARRPRDLRPAVVRAARPVSPRPPASSGGGTTCPFWLVPERG
jgi:hypothetical protein